MPEGQPESYLLHDVSRATESATYRDPATGHEVTFGWMS